MNDDLISRSALLLEMAAGCVPLDEKGRSGVTGDESTIYDYIKDAPAVDAAPVVDGRWGCYEPYSDGYRCSVCKITHRSCTAYCPNCGAKMDK